MTRPRLLDLFCGAGGSAMGYHRAGFEVVGVDIAPQPRYPFEFHQADALEILADLEILAVVGWLAGFDAIHASPVCHDFSALVNVTGSNGTAELLTRTLQLLPATGLPWVVENVIGAPLPTQSDLFGRHGTVLCGTMFDLKVLRHRLFEASFPLVAPDHGSHDGEFYTPAGHGDPNWRHREAHPNLRGAGYHRRCSEAMGIDWMNRNELSQAIPPAYTEYISAQLMSYLRHGQTEDVVPSERL
jgi:DNA (cytosine-5)-methyltransferase 1